MMDKVLLTIFCAAALPVFAQEPAVPKEPPPPITFRVVAVGQTPPERYKTVKFDAETKAKEREYLEKNGSAGLNLDSGIQEDGESPPAMSSGTIMIEEDPEEYPPRPVFLETSKKVKPVFLWLTPGSPGQRIGVNRSSEFFISRDEEGKGRFFSNAIDETTSHLTVFMIPPPGAVKWKDFRTVKMDTSPSKVPAGSVFLVNFSKTVVLGTVGTEKVIVAPGKSQLIPASAALNSRQMVSLELKNRKTDGELVGLTRTARRLRDSDRLFLIAYDALVPVIKGQPTLLMTYVDSCAPAKLRERLKE